MRGLIVKLGGLRAALAATAGLRAVRERHPAAAFTFVCRPGAEAALEGCPAVVETVALEPGAGSLALLSRIRAQHFDVAVTLGGPSPATRLAALSGAVRRVCAGAAPWHWSPFFHRQATARAVDPHEAARDHEVITQAFGFHCEPPAMWFAPSRMQEHGLVLDEGRYVVLHPGASRPERILEIDKWAAVARELVARGEAERVVVSAGPAGEERIMAEALCGLIGPSALSTGGRLRFSQLASLIRGARAFLGVDSPVLQLAAAVGTPVLGVYGPSDYARARPWGVLCRAVRIDATPFEGEARADYLRRMDRALARVTPEQILRATEELLRVSSR
ncbi:MAG: glycosyltransferase family 9 protein [Opitutales bacterium]